MYIPRSLQNVPPGDKAPCAGGMMMGVTRSGQFALITLPRRCEVSQHVQSDPLADKVPLLR